MRVFKCRRPANILPRAAADYNNYNAAPGPRTLARPSLSQPRCHYRAPLFITIIIMVIASRAHDGASGPSSRLLLFLVSGWLLLLVGGFSVSGGAPVGRGIKTVENDSNTQRTMRDAQNARRSFWVK